MKKDQPFTLKGFSGKLKTARLFRGYKSQNQICCVLGIHRQYWNSWENGRKYPRLEELTAISEVLNINITYFFVTNGDIKDYDLLSENFKLHYNRNSLESSLMPFAENVNSKKIFDFLNRGLVQKQLYAVNIQANTGISRSIKEFCYASSKMITRFDESTFQLAYLRQIKKSAMLIIEDMEKFNKKEWDEIFDFARDFSGTLVLTGKKIKEYLRIYGYSERISAFFYLKSITEPDFKRITRAALPGIKVELYGLIRWCCNLGLKELFQILYKIHQQKNEDPHFSMSFEYLLNYCCD